MPQVEVVCKETSIYDEVRLNNGMIILFQNSQSSKPRPYIVTSFRNSKTTSNPRWDDTAQYCSLVDLENGNLVCEEPISRKTTKPRITAHLFKHDECKYADNGCRKMHIYKDVKLTIETGAPL